MTFTQLRHFVALTEHGSFAQTAKAVFLTQPALTRSIAALESELGGRLFDRVGRRISLTPFGQEVLERAQRLVRDAQSLKGLRLGLQTGMTGHLRLGLGSGPGALFSQRLLLHMAGEHPQLRLYLSRGNTDVLLQSLKAQRIDAALGTSAPCARPPISRSAMCSSWGLAFWCARVTRWCSARK